MAKTIQTDGVTAIMHFNSNVESYQMALQMGPSSNECCYCGFSMMWNPPQKPGDSITGNCPYCKKPVEYKTIILSKELAEYFDVRGGTATGRQLGIGGVMHIVLPNPHREFDHLVGKISFNGTPPNAPTDLLSNMNPEAAMLVATFNQFGISTFMNYGKYFLVTPNIPDSDPRSASLVKDEMLQQANRLMIEGKKYLEAGRYDKSEYCFNQVSAWFYEPTAYEYLAISFANQGLIDEAEKWFRKLIEIAPNSPNGYYQLGNLLDVIPNRIPEAEAFYRQALKLNDKIIGANNNLGLLLRNQRRFKEAIVYCRKCVSLSSDTWLYENLGSTLSDSYQFEYPDPAIAKEAENAFFAVLKINAQSLKTLSNLGYLYMLTKRYAESEQLYRKIFNIDPTFSPAYFNMCSLLKEIGRFTEAQEYFRKGKSLDPHSAYTY